MKLDHRKAWSDCSCHCSPDCDRCDGTGVVLTYEVRRPKKKRD